MDLSVSGFHRARALVALLALTAGASALQAANLLTATVSGPVTCSLATGPGSPATITIKASPALTGSATITVTFNAPGNGLVVTAPGSNVLNLANNSTGIIYTVNSAPNCTGNGNNTTVIQFNHTGGVADITASVVDTVTSPFLLTGTVSGPVTCSTVTGPGAPATITIKPFTALTGSSTIAVTTASVGNGLVLTPPSSATLTSSTNSTGIAFTVSAAVGCVGNSTGPTTITFQAGGNADVPVTVSDTVTATTSGLVVSPASIALTCTLTPGNPGTYTRSAAQTISITSAATGGTPFTLDTSAGNDPSWVTLAPTTLTGTANGTPTTFTIQATAGSSPCGGFAAGTTHNFSLHLQNAPAGDKLIPVSLTIVSPSPLTITPVPSAPTVSLTYVKSSGVAGIANVLVSSTVPALFVQVNTATLPTWLTVDNTAGSAPWSLRFSTTSYADSMAPGSYTATVLFKATGYADTPLTVYLLVNNKPPRLSVNSTQVNLTWTIGTPPPAYTIVATSGDSPIQYSIKTAGTLAPVVTAAQLSGLAYSFGTQIGISFNSSVFASSQPGAILTGTVTLTWGTPASTTVVAFQVTVQSPGSTLTSITPSTVPTSASPNSFSVALTGTGFVGGSDVTSKTRIGIVVNNAIVPDSNLAISVTNPSNMILTITVPGTPDANLPFDPTGSGGVVHLGIVNGNGSSIPSGTVSLSIGSGPIIQGITSASSFTETGAAFAPYDMISIFGANFCASNGTGCGSATILEGVPDALTLRYPTSLPLPAPDATGRLVSVNFLQHGTSTLIGGAPLLFASNGQINAIVPAGVSTYDNGTVDVVVTFGFGVAPAATLLQSAPFTVNITATDPGIFTVGSDGQGSGAVLDASYNLIGTSNPAGMRSTGADSDTILIYATGLGLPTSTGDNTGTSAGCIAATPASGTGSYQATLQSATSVSPSLTNIDGAVIQGALLNTGNLPPCITSVPTVTIGGVAAGTVAYAGFVADTVAGLYQLNVPLPSTTGTFYPNYPLTNNPITNITAPVQLPLQITLNGVSQPGVTIWVAPRLKVTDPLGNTTQNPLDVISTTVGVSYSGTVTATETATGTTYSYAVTSGLLPTGLALNGTTGVISGKPAANTAGSYTITVTATDNANVPVKGSVTFTISVAGGLFLTSSNGAPPYHTTFPNVVANVTTVTATGGTFPYTYPTLAFSVSGTPLGMALNSTTGAISTTALTGAGKYTVTVTADDNAVPAVTGTLTFEIDVALGMSKNTTTPQTAGSGSPLVTVTATGGAGAPVYALDAASVTAGLNIDSASGIVDPGTAIAGTYSITVSAADSGTAPGAASPGTGSIGPFNVIVN
jgi:uncharacterized protein (TIGR03437 family)